MGHIEFEYEGDAAYDNEAVKDLFTHIESLAGAAPPGTFDALPPLNDSDPGNASEEVPRASFNFSVQTVAAHLDAKTGAEVTLAAAAYLHLSEGKKSFSRKELLEAMQSANGYYSQVMSGNLSTILKRLVASRRIMTMTGDQMALSATELAQVRAKLA